MTQTIDSNVLRRIYGRRRGWVFTATHFLDLGSRTTVAKVLERLAEREQYVGSREVYIIIPSNILLWVVTHHPQPPAYYKTLLPPDFGLVHVTVEVHQCPGREGSGDL